MVWKRLQVRLTWENLYVRQHGLEEFTGETDLGEFTSETDLEEFLLKVSNGGVESGDLFVLPDVMGSLGGPRVLSGLLAAGDLTVEMAESAEVRGQIMADAGHQGCQLEARRNVRLSCQPIISSTLSFCIYWIVPLRICV